MKRTESCALGIVCVVYGIRRYGLIPTNLIDDIGTLRLRAGDIILHLL
jgi:hypothetical protein